MHPWWCCHGVNGDEVVEGGGGGVEARVGESDGGDRIKRISLTGFPAQSVGSSNTDVLDLPCFIVLITIMSQSRQHVDTSLIHIESRKSPTAVLFDDDTGRISIRHCEY
ncbi:hypothetical protein Tco_0671843 [Tanacetum coccineum]